MINKEILKHDLETIINKGKNNKGDLLHRKWGIVDEISNKYGIFSFYEITNHLENKLDLEYTIDLIIKEILLDIFKEEGVEIDIENKDKSDIRDYIRLINQVYQLNISDEKINNVYKNMSLYTDNEKYKLFITHNKIILSQAII